jgi:hypothetical protein
MVKALACALTHVRQEGFFLEKWIAHYGGIVGRENLFVVIDGDDWVPEVDLTGIHTEVLLGAPRQRIRNDRFIAKEMSFRANALRKRYTHVIRGDVDEYVVVDPAAGLDWSTALEELGEAGYIFAMGVDVVQGPGEDAPLDCSAPILEQRQFGYVSDRYSKPFVISRWNNWAGGAHRLLNRDVRLSRHFFLFHMALADFGIARDRMEARGGGAQHASHVEHQTLRLGVIGETRSSLLFDFSTACDIGRTHFPVEADGSPAGRPRPALVEGANEKGLYTRIPDRFAGLI